MCKKIVVCECDRAAGAGSDFFFWEAGRDGSPSFLGYAAPAYGGGWQGRWGQGPIAFSAPENLPLLLSCGSFNPDALDVEWLSGQAALTFDIAANGEWWQGPGSYMLKGLGDEPKNREVRASYDSDLRREACGEILQGGMGCEVALASPNRPSPAEAAWNKTGIGVALATCLAWACVCIHHALFG